MIVDWDAKRFQRSVAAGCPARVDMSDAASLGFFSSCLSIPYM